MSKDRKDNRVRAASLVADRLRSTEGAVELALGELGRFLADLPAARLQAQVAVPFGHEVYAELAGAYQMMVESRGRIVAAHGLLESARGDLQLPRMDTMPGGDKPPTGARSTAAELRIVEAA